jgi:hypothetical protein
MGAIPTMKSHCKHCVPFQACVSGDHQGVTRKKREERIEKSIEAKKQTQEF